MTHSDTIDRTSERFIVDYGDPENNSPARMVDIDELTTHLSKDIEYTAYGYADPPAVYRYLPGNPPQLEPLTLTCTQPAQFDEHDWAHPVWELTGPDGTQWVTMSIRIDGRA